MFLRLVVRVGGKGGDGVVGWGVTGLVFAVSCTVLGIFCTCTLYSSPLLRWGGWAGGLGVIAVSALLHSIQMGIQSFAVTLLQMFSDVLMLQILF